jgi:hypothetical protein
MARKKSKKRSSGIEKWGPPLLQGVPGAVIAALGQLLLRHPAPAPPPPPPAIIEPAPSPPDWRQTGKPFDLGRLDQPLGGDKPGTAMLYAHVVGSTGTASLGREIPTLDLGAMISHPSADPIRGLGSILKPNASATSVEVEVRTPDVRYQYHVDPTMLERLKRELSRDIGDIQRVEFQVEPTGKFPATLQPEPPGPKA